MSNTSVTRSNTLATFMKNVTKLKISSDVIDDLIPELDDLVIKITKASAVFAVQDDRKTIMPADLEKALEDILRRKSLTVHELVQKIEPLSILELKDLSNQIKQKAEDLLKQRSSKSKKR